MTDHDMIDAWLEQLGSRWRAVEWDGRDRGAVLRVYEAPTPEGATLPVAATMLVPHDADHFLVGFAVRPLFRNVWVGPVMSLRCEDGTAMLWPMIVQVGALGDLIEAVRGGEAGAARAIHVWTESLQARFERMAGAC